MSTEQKSKDNSATLLVIVAMAILVASFGVDGRMGILLSAISVALCAIAVVIGLIKIAKKKS